MDVEYQGSKKAKISVWRRQIVSNDAGEGELIAVQAVTGQIFRDENGNLNDSTEAGLHLQLQDFATEALVEPCGPLCDGIYSSATTLCAYLERAENIAAMIEQERRRQSYKTLGEKASPGQ